MTTSAPGDATVTARPIPFRDEAEDVLGRVRGAVGEILASMTGVRRPSELRDTLGIDNRLSWRLFKVAEATNPLAMGQYVPGPTAMGRFLERAAANGVPTKTVEATREAAAAFDRLVVRHAPDRGAFDAMVAATAGDDAQELDWEHKRALFKAATRVHGIHSRTLANCSIVSPGAEPDRIDIAMLRGDFGIRRLRPNAPLALARHTITGDYAVTPPGSGREPLDPDAYNEHGVALLGDFCSRPLPAIHTSELSSGGAQTDLVGDDVGLESEITCVLGYVMRGIASPYADDTTPRFRFNRPMHVPTEVLIHDVMIPTDMFGPLEPRLLVLSGESMLDLAPGHEEKGLLAIQESVEHLGRGLHVMHTPDVPRYGEMLRYSFERLGWDPERFDVYRCRVEYPVMPSVVSMQFYLPERAGDQAGSA